MATPRQDPNPGGSHLEVRVVVRAPLLYVLLSGQLDFSTVGRLPIDAETPAGMLAVVVDLGGLSFCGIKGVRGLLALRERHLAENRRVHFIHVSPPVRRLFEVAGETQALDRMP